MLKMSAHGNTTSETSSVNSMKEKLMIQKVDANISMLTNLIDIVLTL